MATATTSNRPGLGSLGDDLRGAWRRLQAWPLLAWLTPALPVRLRRTDGTQVLWTVGADGLHPLAAGSQPAGARAYAAVELPEDDLLLRRLTLPPLGADELGQAIRLDVLAASPFAPEDLTWGWTTRRAAGGGPVEVLVALASRRRVGEFLLQQPEAAQDPEVWAWQPPFAPIVLPGYGETQRAAGAFRGRRVAGALLLAALALLAAIAVTPVAQTRMRAVQAVQAMDALVRRADPAVKQRAALATTIDAGNALGELLAQRSNPLQVLDLLTQVLPDDTSLLGVTLQGRKISINGLTNDAASLMQQLSSRPEFREVKAPSPATRPLGSNKDLFTIEMVLAPEAAPAKQAAAGLAATGVAVAPGPAASGPAPQAAAAPPGTSGAPAASALATASPLPPGAVPAPPAPPAQSGGASFGGASFGAPAKAP